MNNLSLLIALLLISALFLPLAAAPPGKGKEELPPETDRLPGYYQFFMKEGRQVRINDEKKRDEQIESGTIKVEKIGKKAPNIGLPNKDKKIIKLEAYRGKKNVIVTTFRSWW